MMKFNIPKGQKPNEPKSANIGWVRAKTDKGWQDYPVTPNGAALLMTQLRIEHGTMEVFYLRETNENGELPNDKNNYYGN